MVLEDQAKLITDEQGYIYIGLKLAYVVAACIIMGGAFLAYNYRVLTTLENLVVRHVEDQRGHKMSDGRFMFDFVRENSEQIRRLADAMESAVTVQTRQEVQLRKLDKRMDRQGFIIESAFPDEAKRAPKNQ